MKLDPETEALWRDTTVRTLEQPAECPKCGGTVWDMAMATGMVCHSCFYHPSTYNEWVELMRVAARKRGLL